MNEKKLLKEQIKVSNNQLYAAVGYGSVSSLLLILQAWLLANIINDVIFEHANLSQVQNNFWFLLLLFIVRSGLSWTSNQYSFKAAEKIKLNLRDKIHKHIQSIGPINSGRKHSGAKVNILVDGIEALEQYYSLYLPAVSFMAIVPLAILLVVFPIDWISGLVLFFTGPIIVFFMILVGKGAESLNQKQWKQLTRLSGHFLDTIQGLTTLKMFNASRREAALIAKISDEYRENTMVVLKVAFLSSLLLEFFSSIGTAIVAVLIGFRLLEGEMTFLHGLYILMLAPEFYIPIRNMGAGHHARMDGIGAAEEMIQLLQIKPIELTTPNTTKKRTEVTIVKDIKNNGLAIDLNNVHFSYDKVVPVLSSFNLHLPANKKTALIGESGSGKSTLINLLLGFVKADKGQIQINKYDLSNLSLKKWREQIAWLPQKPYLFRGTIADNIRMGKENATDEAIRKVAQMAYCDTFIEKMPKAYQTEIGERGTGLSGGQIQRIALARAFLKDAPVLILDEATANLDKHSEKLIEKSIALFAKNKTIIVIAHRLHTIEKADQIVVIKDGKAFEVGKHKDLMQKSATYRHLIDEYYETFTLS